MLTVAQGRLISGGSEAGEGDNPRTSRAQGHPMQKPHQGPRPNAVRSKLGWHAQSTANRYLMRTLHGATMWCSIQLRLTNHHRRRRLAQRWKTLARAGLQYSILGVPGANLQRLSSLTRLSQ